METNIFIVLTLLSLSSASSKTQFKKCCPPGEILLGTSKVNCAPTPQHVTELYSVYYAADQQNATANAFPECEQLEDVSTTPLFQLNPTDFLQESSCLEVLHDSTSHQSIPIIFDCRSHKDRDESYKTTSVPLPRLLDIRRCCPRNAFFDERSVTCESIPDDIVRDENFSDIDEFLSLLPRELDTLDFLNVTRIPPRCSGAKFTYGIDPEDLVFENGTLQVTLASSTAGTERIEVTSENACLELTSNFHAKRRLVVRVCRDSDRCQNNSCVKKCCAENVSTNGTRCISNRWVNSSSGFYNGVAKRMEVNNVTEYGLLFGLKCPHGKYMVSADEPWNITREGYIRMDPNFEPLHYNQYCLDMLNNDTSADRLNVFVCFEETNKEPSTVRFIIKNILEAISCVFLLLTLLVYACLPVLQNLHGKTLMCHSASLMVAFACLSIIPWVTPDETMEEPFATTLCATFGFVMLFAFLSSFCWLNVMCFDIWRTFGRLRGTITRGRAHRKRFLFYCMYAWGLSLFITILGILSDRMHLLPINFRPNFGFAACWFEDQPGMYGELIFFRGPVAIQLTLNVVFFILTSERCSKVKAEIRRVADPLDPRSKRFHADKTKFIMNVKLFVVMGISWIAEIISSFVNQYTNYEWQEQVFYATDVLNCLQGLLIFLLFVMKRRVHLALKKRLGFDGKKKCTSQATSTLQDPFKVKKSASNSTLMSSFAVSVAP